MLVVGNWKMHSNAVSALQRAADIGDGLAGRMEAVDVVLAPPFPYLAMVADSLAGTGIGLAAQNVHAAPEGAYTGEVSASMLVDVGCTFVIVGHSERRVGMRETDAEVAEKALAACNNGLQPIVCVGESAQQRQSGQTEECIRLQLAPVLERLADATETLIVAYEPVWAIGSGTSAQPEYVQRVHRQIRAQLRSGGLRSRVLYGGSVTVDNVHPLLSLPDVDGALIGGASLRAGEFIQICHLAQEILR